MKLERVSLCLLAFVLVPSCSGTGLKVKAKTKDPWDAPEDGEEPQAEGGAVDSEMSPEDQAGVMQELAKRSAVRRAQKQHAVMSQFMKNFANNMRLAVLADSRGDMPEEERQRLMAKAEQEKEAANGGGPAGDESGPPPQEADGAEEMQPPPPPRRRARARSHMLNMAAARHMAHHRARLLPEAEGIGFPPPEGMAPDPSGDGMPSDPGMAPPAYDMSGESEEAPAPRPRPRRHHLHMLNMRPGERREVHPEGHHAHGRQLPPGVVRDEMGRAMPLLFQGPKPAHSGAFHTFSMPLGGVALLCLFLSF